MTRLRGAFAFALSVDLRSAPGQRSNRADFPAAHHATGFRFATREIMTQIGS